MLSGQRFDQILRLLFEINKLVLQIEILDNSFDGKKVGQKKVVDSKGRISFTNEVAARRGSSFRDRKNAVLDVRFIDEIFLTKKFLGCLKNESILSITRVLVKVQKFVNVLKVLSEEPKETNGLSSYSVTETRGQTDAPVVNIDRFVKGLRAKCTIETFIGLLKHFEVLFNMFENRFEILFDFKL